MARHTIVKSLPRTVSAVGGGKTKKGEWEGNTGAKTRESRAKYLPQTTGTAWGEHEETTNTLNER